MTVTICVFGCAIILQFKDIVMEKNHRIFVRFAMYNNQYYIASAVLASYVNIYVLYSVSRDACTYLFYNKKLC